MKGRGTVVRLDAATRARMAGRLARRRQEAARNAALLEALGIADRVYDALARKLHAFAKREAPRLVRDYLATRAGREAAARIRKGFARPVVAEVPIGVEILNGAALADYVLAAATGGRRRRPRA